MMALESNDLSSKLEIEFIFPKQDHVRSINEIFIRFNEPVIHGDIEVRFFEKVNENVVWECFPELGPIRRHRRQGSMISVQCPRYRSLEINEPVMTYVQIRRLSDGTITSAKPFKFLPLISGIEIVDHDGQKQLDTGYYGMCLACNIRINPDDIQVRFFDEVDGEVVWEEFAQIDYHLTACLPLLYVLFPKYYKSLEIDVPHETHIQCIRPSDGIKSTPVSHTFVPPDTKEPLPLMRICRRVIRQCIGKYQVVERIDSLQLPQQTKMYLLQRT